MPAPHVSILIPVYNRERYIEQCIRSAANQTYCDLEIVVVDNQSADATWSICETLALSDQRIRLFRNHTNLGPVRNWQRCLEEARGQLAALLFSDDMLMPEFLEKTTPYLADPEIGFAFAAVKHGSVPERSRVIYTWNGRAGKISSGIYLRDSMFHNGVLPCSPAATLFRLADLRRSLAIGISSPSIRGFAEHGAGPDLLLALQTAAAYPAVAHLTDPLAYFRDHADSMSRTRAGELLDAYTQARLWFGAGQSDPLWLSRAFGGYWLRQMKTARGWVNPREIEAKFLAPEMRRPRYLAALWHGIGRVFRQRN